MPLRGIYFFHDFRVACKGEARFHISQPVGDDRYDRVACAQLLRLGS